MRVSRTGRVRPVAIGGLALVLVLGLVGAWLLAARSGEEDDRFCAGVGLAGPAASTPDGALRRWLELNPAEPALDDWDRTGDVDDQPTSGRRSVGYESDASEQYQEVLVGTGGLDPEGSRLGLDEWMAEGGCVRSPSS